MAGSSRGRRRRRVVQARAIALFTIALTVSAGSSAIAARTAPTVEGTVMQVPADSSPKPSKPPKPRKPPKPSPTTSPDPEPSPSSESPSPDPDPTPSPTSTSSPAPNPAPTSPPGTTPAPPPDDPTAPGGAPRQGDTPSGSGDVPPGPYETALDLFEGSADRGARDGTGSLFGTVASIIDELASSDGQAIQAAEAPSTCPGSACASSPDAAGTRTLFIVLICLAIASAGALVIRAMSRRSTTAPPSDRP